MPADESPTLNGSRWFERPHWKAIAWWEKRRPVFNLAVLAAGVASIIIIETIGSHFTNPGEDVEEPLGIILGVLIYGTGANACYTLGWLTELGWGGSKPNRTETQRRKIFRRGMTFSVVLTLVPSVLIPLLWVVFGFQHQR
jgi:hypothetical protein